MHTASKAPPTRFDGRLSNKSLSDNTKADMTEVKKTFLDFVAATNYWIIDETVFKEFRDTVPQFGLDILDRIPDAVHRGAYWPHEYPEACKFCDLSCATRPGSYWALLEVRGGKKMATCSNCLP
ncbi:hypothetical protein F5B20DRAFT_534989 [Whalleya microplaca]|nr:hypothetical protein F5B20DRAFT_534989 [Whalleya microplaca]